MISLLLAAVTAAEPPPSVPPPPIAPAVGKVAPVDPARVAAANKLIALTRIEATLDRMFVQLSPSFAQSVLGVLLSEPSTRPVIDSLTAKEAGNKDRIVAILSQEFMRAVKERFPAFLNRVAERYAEVFTIEELDTINAFYSSGPGAKALELLPQLQVTLSQDGRELGKDAGREAGLRAFQRIQAEIAPDAGGKTS